MSAPGPPVVETLGNGLTLVTAPSVTAGVSTVAVHVGVGFRAEPADCSGLAHLFEHLMFQGSAHVEPGGHFRQVEAVGGRVGGHTRHDYTEFFDVVPSEALLETVRLEADRLAGPRLDRATLDTQVEVIRAEIAQQILGVPHGGFPWLHLPPVMYSMPANTHDGYGDVAALSAVDVAACERFFADWYAPHRVVVTIEGDVGDDAERARIRELLAAIPARPASAAVATDEPALTADRHRTVAAANAPEPVWAVGFRLPDPLRSPELYGACTALTMLLPVHAPQLRLTARCGWYGVPLDARTPDALVLSTYPRPGVAAEPLTEAMRELLDQWRRDRPAPGVLATARSRIRLGQYQRAQRPGHRARRLGAAQLLFGSVGVDAAADPATALDRDLLDAASAFLLDQHVASVLLEPAAAAQVPA
ncbi:M16 family metallopeptidase [Nocardioides pantholopis]|uniref:M16 family metallopeptidase n=1 Tax=Nocardioides pantholopis TaxID=2483798 RepID=UPI0013DE221F|nr:pitrilysin family protein [Nocardioides pantholopis]